MTVGSIGLHNMEGAGFHYRSFEGSQWVNLEDGGITYIALHLDSDLEKRIDEARYLMQTAVTAFNKIIEEAQNKILANEEKAARLKEEANVGSDKT